MNPFPHKDYQWLILLGILLAIFVTVFAVNVDSQEMPLSPQITLDMADDEVVFFVLYRFAQMSVGNNHVHQISEHRKIEAETICLEQANIKRPIGITHYDGQPHFLFCAYAAEQMISFEVVRAAWCQAFGQIELYHKGTKLFCVIERKFA